MAEVASASTESAPEVASLSTESAPEPPSRSGDSAAEPESESTVDVEPDTSDSTEQLTVTSRLRRHVPTVSNIVRVVVHYTGYPL